MFELIPFDRRNHSVSAFDPFRAFDDMERSFFRDVPSIASFRTDVTDTGDAYKLEAELPGFKKEDIKIDVEDDCLTISAERKVDEDKKDENSFMFEVRIEEQKHDMQDPEDKTAFYNEIARKLLSFPEELERNNYIEAVAAKYQIGFDNLRRLVNQLGNKAGIVKEQTPLKSGIHENKKKEDGMKQSQKLLLTWLIEHTGLFQIIRPFVTPDDFTEDLYRRVAEVLFAQFEDAGSVNPAKIISMFDNEEEQREVAGLFNAHIHEVETKSDMEKAVRETIIRIKDNSIKYRSDHLDPTDMQGLMKVVEDKRALEQLEKLHISID